MKERLLLAVMIALAVVLPVTTAFPDKVPIVATPGGSSSLVSPDSSVSAALGNHEKPEQTMIQIQRDILAEVKRIQIDTSSRLQLEQERLKLVKELVQQRRNEHAKTVV